MFFDQVVYIYLSLITSSPALLCSNVEAEDLLLQVLAEPSPSCSTMSPPTAARWPDQSRRIGGGSRRAARRTGHTCGEGGRGLKILSKT